VAKIGVITDSAAIGSCDENSCETADDSETELDKAKKSAVLCDIIQDLSDVQYTFIVMCITVLSTKEQK